MTAPDLVWLALFAFIGIWLGVTVKLNGKERRLPWYAGIFAAPILALTLGAMFRVVGWALAHPLNRWLP